jgi:hypothetical protein
MKKLLPVFLLLATSATAQITLEKNFNSPNISIKVARLSNGDLKYYGGITNNEIVVYNEDHSLFATIPIPTGSISYTAAFLSDKLFDTDAGLEIAVMGPVVINSRNMMIVEMDGSVSTIIDSVNDQSANIVNMTDFYTGSTGIKMVITKNANIPGSPSNTYKAVYSLPGIYNPTAISADETMHQALAYPNPANHTIRLPYNLTSGEQGTITVLNATGQTVKQATVDATFNDLLLNTGELPEGAYIYTVDVKGKQRQSSRFVVQH